MSYRGDIALGDTIDIKFTTRQFSTGAPFTLAGTPSVAAYPDNSTTEITAGITLSVDFDTRTGLNNIRIVATSGNGYAAGSNYDLVITAGTVDSVSVVGEVVGSFSIENRSALRPTTAGRTLDVATTGEAGIDLGNVTGTLTQANVGWVDANSRIDVGSWLGTAVTTSATSSKPEVDSFSISDSTTAANNVEANIGNLDAAITSLNDLSAVEVNAEVDTALADIHLDHLIAVADPGAIVANNSFLAKLVSASATATFSDFVNTTDSLQALRDQGDSAWITATTVDLNADQSGVTVGTVNALAAGAVDAAAIATDAIDADALAADAATEIANAVNARPQKNVALSNIPVFMADSIDGITGKTGLSLTVTRSIDGGAFGAATGTAAEIANGMYQFDASQADMNGDLIIFRFVGTGANDTLLAIPTRP